MDLDDDRWGELKGGYGVPYDPRRAIRQLGEGDNSAWNELWQELHHQGDLGEASYASLPELVRIYEESGASDWNLYALAVTIEDARENPKNPPIPDWLLPDYQAAWIVLEKCALSELSLATEQELVDSLLATIALAKGRRTLARMAMLTEDEREEMLGTAGWG